MIGQVFIHFLFGCAISTFVLYALAYKRQDEEFARWGRWLFRVLFSGLLLSSGMLIADVVQHRFEYTYVWNYSSTELPLHLLIACFYSGQEGSFLLWTLLVAAIGMLLIPYVRRHDYESPVMMMYGAILAFLTLLLVAKNPFTFYWQTFAEQGITPVDVPLQGKGLNPLLHNAWITIHPPILFTGFAAMTVSFAFAMAGLLRKEYQEWINVALPWTLFGTAILGFGIMLGGFWAYETLGWGGFWGWDPVENSSLIPWLVSVALVHTMLIQKRTRGLVKTNMILAVSAFVMVLYSTFLTRSGVLGDTSVHSFVDPGNFAFWILLLFMLTFTSVGVVLLLMRRKNMDAKREEFNPKTREFTTSIGAALIMASAIFVTIGTSWPVIMEVIGQPKVAVATDFYNTVHAVLLPAILMLNALSIIFQWRSSSWKTVRRRLTIALPLAALLTIAEIPFGVTQIMPLALSFGAWIALVTNVMIGFKIVRKSPTSAGAYISHTGIALLIFGVITTSSYSEYHHVVLEQGKPTTVADYTLTYLGKEQVELEFKDREKFKYHVQIDKNGGSKTVSAVLYWSDYNKKQSAFLEPGIRWGWMDDLYVSPKATGVAFDGKLIEMTKNALKDVPIDSNYKVLLDRFTMPMQEGPGPNGEMRIGAIYIVTNDLKNTSDTVKTVTSIVQSSGELEFLSSWVMVPGTDISLAVTKITRDNTNPSNSSATTAFRKAVAGSAPPPETFTVEFSVKPLISLVWIGVITMVSGFFFSIVRLTRSASKA